MLPPRIRSQLKFIAPLLAEQVVKRGVDFDIIYDVCANGGDLGWKIEPAEFSDPGPEYWKMTFGKDIEIEGDYKHVWLTVTVDGLQYTSLYSIKNEDISPPDIMCPKKGIPTAHKNPTPRELAIRDDILFFLIYVKMDKRLVAQKLRELGMDVGQISSVFECSTRTIYRWFEGHPPPSGKRGRSPVVKDEHLNLVEHMLERNPESSLKQIQEMLKSHGVCCHVSSVWRFLKRNSITHKKLSYVFKQASVTKISHFKQAVEAMRGRPFMALDEASFQTKCVPRYGWAKKGRKSVCRRQGGSWETFSLLLCVCPNRKIHWKLYDGAVNSERFHDFLKNINGRRFRNKPVVILDNASIHRATHSCLKTGRLPIVERANAQGIELLYLPPYSPQFNPTEICFSVIRRYVESRKPECRISLETAVAEGVNLIGAKLEAMFDL